MAIVFAKAPFSHHCSIECLIAQRKAIIFYTSSIVVNSHSCKFKLSKTSVLVEAYFYWLLSGIWYRHHQPTSTTQSPKFNLKRFLFVIRMPWKKENVYQRLYYFAWVYLKTRTNMIAALFRRHRNQGYGLQVGKRVRSFWPRVVIWR